MGEKIKIDYDNFDVARIMVQLKDDLAAEPDETSHLVEGDMSPSSQAPSMAGQGRAKRALLRLMSPLKPLIKLFILPVAEEHRQTVLHLDQANRRIDRLEKHIGGLSERIDRLQEHTKLLHHLCHNLVIEMSKLKIEEETLKTKTRIMEKDFALLGKREKALEKEVLK